jgi:hypothetical protein
MRSEIFQAVSLISLALIADGTIIKRPLAIKQLDRDAWMAGDDADFRAVAITLDRWPI